MQNIKKFYVNVIYVFLTLGVLLLYNQIHWSFAKASHIFSTKKYWHIWDINVWNFNVSLTNDVVSFEQPGPGILLFLRFLLMHLSCEDGNDTYSVSCMWYTCFGRLMWKLFVLFSYAICVWPENWFKNKVLFCSANYKCALLYTESCSPWAIFKSVLYSNKILKPGLNF